VPVACCPSVQSFCARGGNNANHATHDDAKQRAVSASDAEAALIRALDRASAACEWDTVKVLAEELRARRLSARAVRDLDAERARRVR
jgi:hypothetical protein